MADGYSARYCPPPERGRCGARGTRAGERGALEQDGSWERCWLRARRWSLVGAGLWCVVLGFGLAGALVKSGSLGRAGTLVVLGAVGMLVLPALTALALRLDNAERRKMLALRNTPTPDRLAHAAHTQEGARREPPAHRVRGVSRAVDRAG